MKISKKKINIIKKNIINSLKTIYDPEIPVNIYELGLIYNIEINDTGYVKIIMTLTTPNCPVADSLPEEVKKKIKLIDMVKKVNLLLTFDPPWNTKMLSEEAKLELGLL